MCACDPGYFGIDCAQGYCPYGDDPISTDQHNEIQWLTLKTVGDGTKQGIQGAASTYAAGDLDLEGTFRLAYKDEYEVARLYAGPEFAASLNTQFEGDFTLSFHLAPPLGGRGFARCGCETSRGATRPGA